jgi:hypothetical protein
MFYSIKKQNYAFMHIGNEDKTVVYFDSPWNYNDDAKASKEIKSRNKGYEKNLVMVALCVTVDDHELSP